jgi:hypothetical protein
MTPRPWANVIPNSAVSVPNNISDARDFIMFKAVCKCWNCARSGEARPFDPWILKSEFISESGAVTNCFFFVVEEKEVEVVELTLISFVGDICQVHCYRIACHFRFG